MKLNRQLEFFLRLGIFAGICYIANLSNINWANFALGGFWMIVCLVGYKNSYHE